MNVLFFIRPKQEVAFIYSDSSLRQAIEKMNSCSYNEIPVLDRDGHYMYSVSALDLLLFIRKKGEYSENISLNSYLKDVKIHRDIKAIKVDNDIEDLYDVALSQNYIPIVDDRNVFSGIVTRKAVMNWLINKNKDIK